MSERGQKIAIEEIAKSIDIPDSAYEQAEKRYQDLGDWFSDPQAKCSQFSPHIYPQGSFRLGTVTKPLTINHKYDLDIGCRLRYGVSKYNASQEQLKLLVGFDLETYRNRRQIKEALEEKHRCWCLNYADKLSFHMDVVPSIPEETSLVESLRKSMVQRGENEVLALSVAQHAGAITDNRDPNYSAISTNWRVSNSEGYAVWFKSRTQLAGKILEKSVEGKMAAQIDDLPLYKVRSPLQRCIQILKRHRDTMYEEDPNLNPDSKPASIIITTLSATAYNGEVDLVVALQNILSKMEGLVGMFKPRIPNPINPEEDFTDRWDTERGLELELELHFWRWLAQAKKDIGDLGTYDDAEFLLEKSLTRFGADLDGEEIKRWLGGTSYTRAVAIGGLATTIPGSPVDPRGGGRFG